MKYTAEEVRALFEAWAEENGYDVLRIEPDYNDGFTAAAWHGYQAAYAERIKVGVSDADVDAVIESVSHINTDGMDGDSWDRILVRAALEHFAKGDRHE